MIDKERDNHCFPYCNSKNIVKNGQNKNEVKKVFKDKLDKKATLITDCKSSYEKFCEDNSIKLEQVKSDTYVNLNGYNLATINSLHSEWSTFLSHFKRVSTKIISNII